MRILYFSSRECWPVNSGGRLRDYHLARRLARAAQVTYVGLTYPGETRYEEPTPGLPPPESIFERIIHVPKARAYSLLNVIRGFAGPTPVTVWNNMAAGVGEVITQLGRAAPFDSIQIEGVHLVNYLSLLRAFAKRPPVICDWHNIESELMWRYSESASGFARKLYSRRTAALIEGKERELLVGCDAHTVVSTRERDKLQAVDAKAAITVVENGVDTEYFADAEIDRAYQQWGAKPSGAPVRNRIVFVGSMDYHANIDAASYFAREVWPSLQGRLAAGSRFAIVGRSPAAEVQALTGIPGVEVTGTVADMRPYYREALAVVVPLRVGSGTRLKILEAMAAGVPIVSTTLGAEGLDVHSGTDILIADDPHSTVTLLASLSRQPEIWHGLARAGRELAVRRYDWQALGETLLAVHTAAIERAFSRA